VSERVVKHKELTYRVPVTDEDGGQVTKTTKHGQERPKYRRVHARRYATIDDAEMAPDDLERAEAFGAFFTDEELEAIRGGEASEPAEATKPPEGVPEDLNFDDNDQLVGWIKTAKPTAATVVAAAGDDPDKAIALMDAEEEASGGQPRKSVMDPLGKIAES
jgi:hypothetical protein